MKLSIVIPVYNERDTILTVLGKVKALNREKEIIVVDDCSTDGTKELLSNINDTDIRVFFHGKNRGKGAALRTGFAAVTGDVIAIQDADLEYEPEELNELIKPIEEAHADVVYGSRLSGGKPQRAYMFWHKAGNTFLVFITNILYNTTLTDIETCYKVFRADLLKGMKLKSDDFTIEAELTAKLLKRNLRVYEMPISYFGRTYAEGKKITWRHGLSALFALIKYKFMD